MGLSAKFVKLLGFNDPPAALSATQSPVTGTEGQPIVHQPATATNGCPFIEDGAICGYSLFGSMKRPCSLADQPEIAALCYSVCMPLKAYDLFEAFQLPGG